jgi:hypothetical protein
MGQGRRTSQLAPRDNKFRPPQLDELCRTLVTGNNTTFQATSTKTDTGIVIIELLFILWLYQSKHNERQCNQHK